MRRLPLHPSAQLVWGIASLEASFSGSPTIQPVHFLSAILRIVDGVHEADAGRLGLHRTDLEAVEDLIPATKAILGLTDKEITRTRRTLRQPWASNPRPLVLRMLHRSQASRELFSQAATVAAIKGDSVIAMTHLVEELLRNLPGEAAEILDAAATEATRAVPRTGLTHTGEGDEQGTKGTPRPAPSRTPAIDAIGRNLSGLAREGKLPKIVGRHDELLTMARHLIRTSKRNVLLIGEAGVGKTALAEGLAQHILKEDIPEQLSSMRIVEISVVDLIAGTQYRGDMEERARRILDEAKSDENLILFIDEFHQLVGAGKTNDSGVNLGTIMKPALARGEIRCIGATTTDEYERYLKEDKPLLRRFQIVRVKEPSVDQALRICRSWAHRIEEAQNVAFDEEAILAAVELSRRHIRSRALPDSAIDILENAATFVRLPSFSAELQPPEKGAVSIRREHVISLLEQHYDVVLEGDGALDLELLGRTLETKVVGQAHAIKALLSTLGGIADRESKASHPLGVLMFIGPTGVGKTYCAEIIGHAFRGGGFARFNMNEYKERHEISRLIGAPPGFVGHEQPGAVFRYLEETPRGVILLDEMEKAHPEIQDYFLQVFDKGEARDTRGRAVDFRNQLFVMTCNIDLSSEAERPIGFRAAETRAVEIDDEGVRSRLRDYFREEFLGRLDAVIAFATLEASDFESLFNISLQRLQERLAEEAGISLEATNDVRTELANKAASLGEGVRGFDRLFKELIIQPISELTQGVDSVSLKLDWSDGDVKILDEQAA